MGDRAGAGVGRAIPLGYWPFDASTGFGGHLLRHGFSDEGEEPAMGVALANLPETLPLHDGVTIERVSDRAAQEQ